MGRRRISRRTGPQQSGRQAAPLKYARSCGGSNTQYTRWSQASASRAYTRSSRVIPRTCIRPRGRKYENSRVGGAGKDRFVTMDFEMAPANAIEEANPRIQSTVRYFHFGQSIWRRPQSLGPAGKFIADDEFELRVKKLADPSFLPHRSLRGGVRSIREGVPWRRTGDRGLLCGDIRRKAGPKWPAKAAVRTRLAKRRGSGARRPLRGNNAPDAFNNALACTVVQAARPHIGRFLEAQHLRKNTKCVATKTVSAQRPIADRGLAEVGGRLRNHVEKRQGG